MASTATKQSSGEPTRKNLIVSEALDLFTELPYDQVSIDDVCERAGVAHGLVSYYFGGKRGLFAAAADLAWSEFASSQSTSTDDVSAVARTREYLTRHFEWVSQHPERYRFLIRSELADAELAEIMRTARQRALMQVMEGLGCPSNPQPALHMAMVSWSGFLDSATLDWATNGAVELDYVIELCVQALVASVRAVNGVYFGDEDEARALEEVSSP
jgi:AcrR family transcriptional regulator